MGHKAFRLSSFEPTDKTKKWYQYRKVDRREVGYTAIIGFLAGPFIGGVVGSVLSVVGMACGIAWLFMPKDKKRNQLKDENHEGK